MNSGQLKRLLLTALTCLLPVAARAHVGNPDIYFDGTAGPYRLFVTVRPPLVIPGVAEIQVRTTGSRVKSLEAVPVPLDAEDAKFAPVPDPLKVSSEDPQFLTGSLWIMAAGSWQVRITADGPSGRATLAVPVPSVARTTKKMQWGLGAGLTVLMLLLVGGLVLMAGASVREAQLDAGATPDEAQEKRAPRDGRNLCSGCRRACLGLVVVERFGSAIPTKRFHVSADAGRPEFRRASASLAERPLS
jgi:hypothetical protein